MAEGHNHETLSRIAAARLHFETRASRRPKQVWNDIEKIWEKI